MLERADQLIAESDGKPARGYGTADVVQLDRDPHLTIIWAAGASR